MTRPAVHTPPHPLPHLLAVDRDDERCGVPEGFVPLHRNERVSPFPDWALAGMLGRVRSRDFSLYPDPSPLYERLSRRLGLPADRLILTPGSDGVFRRVMHAFLRPGDAVLIPDPTYLMYPIHARLFQGAVAVVPYEADLTLDVDRFTAKIRPGVRLVIVADPGQPTGSALAPGEVERIVAAAAAAGAVCLIDEAYHPFGPGCATDLIPAHSNLIVARTFSKAGGVAGLRLGYAAAQPALIDALNRVRGGAEVNAMAIIAGCYLLDHPEIMEDFRKGVEESRTMLCAAAARLGWGAPRCHTNFQLLSPAGRDPAAVVAALRDRGYLIKGGFAAPQLARHVRVTLDLPEIIGPFIAALEDAEAELAGRACDRSGGVR